MGIIELFGTDGLFIGIGKIQIPVIEEKIDFEKDPVLIDLPAFQPEAAFFTFFGTGMDLLAIDLSLM